MVLGLSFFVGFFFSSRERLLSSLLWVCSCCVGVFFEAQTVRKSRTWAWIFIPITTQAFFNLVSPSKNWPLGSHQHYLWSQQVELEE